MLCGYVIVIDIVMFGQLLFYVVFVGVIFDNVDWVCCKCNVVVYFCCSLYVIGLCMQQVGVMFVDKYGLLVVEYVLYGGLFLLIVVGVGVIGLIIVFGLLQCVDYEFVVEVLCVEFGYDYVVLVFVRS